LADFGLARLFTPEKPDRDYTFNVVTRWYRPPELFLGQTKYTAAIDMWGVGCVIAEIFRRRPLMAGSTDMKQIELILQLIGQPSEKEMGVFRSLPQFNEYIQSFNPAFGQDRSLLLRERLRKFDPHAVDLIEKLLKYDPGKRLTAEEALDHLYFSKDPKMAEPGTNEYTLHLK
jgi:serine/threonine-protein kinase BUR1